jgi:NAD-dependent DNA ligase
MIVSLIKGMATKSAEAFVYKINDFIDFLIECNLQYKLQPIIQENPIEQHDHHLYGKTVVLTGSRDKTIIEFLKNIGANNGTSISKNTFIVVAKNKDEDTEKLKQAKKLNITIMSTEEFIETYINK